MQSNLEHLSLQDLCDMLVTRTKELMQLMGKKNADGYVIRDIQIEVEKIQEVIKSRKPETLNFNPRYNQEGAKFPRRKPGIAEWILNLFG